MVAWMYGYVWRGNDVDLPGTKPGRGAGSEKEGIGYVELGGSRQFRRLSCLELSNQR